MLNALSIDVEDWFCPHYFAKYINKKDWDSLEIRIDININTILEILNIRKIHATFFLLGWIAERLPNLIEKIVENGHEIGIHGYDHTQIFNQTREEFRNDIEKTLKVIKSIADIQVYGYRAPVFSVIERTRWALDVLKEFGIKYDSSVYPDSIHPEYGIAGFNHNIHIQDNGLIEVPLNSVKVLSMNIPISGGGYFRLYPYFLSKFLIKKHIRRLPLIFYLHPWELDDFSPPIKTNLIERLRYNNGKKNMGNKLSKLLYDFEFTTISDLLISKGYNLNEN